jgi:hypothetical protein
LSGGGCGECGKSEQCKRGYELCHGVTLSAACVSRALR